MSIILAVDSSGKTAGVCILKNDCIVYDYTLDAGLTHSETLLNVIDTALQACTLTAADITSYAVSVGPGSFTGLRIGMALVKGLALPYQTPIIPVSTLDALASACPVQGLVIPTLDARRNEVYWAAYSKTSAIKKLTQEAAGPIACIENEIDLQHKPAIFVGDGAELCYNHYKLQNNAILPPVPCSIALGVAQTAAANLDAGVCANLVHPTYIRLSQAERERLEKATK